MLIAFDQLRGVAARLAEGAAGRAVAANVRRDRNAEAFARGEAKALQGLMAVFGQAAEQGGLADLERAIAMAAFGRGVAIALVVERSTCWLASMARAGLELEGEARAAALKDAFADAWLKRGP